MVTEFAFRGADTGHPNTMGAGPVIATQEAKARVIEGYVCALSASPAVVGYHWFCMVDQPLQGRKQDGENSNYGLLRLDDSPWPDVVHTFSYLNRSAEFMHASGSSAAGRC
jgi:hypothetical protein